MQVYLAPEYPDKSLVMSQVPGLATASRQESAAQMYWHAFVIPVTPLAPQTPFMHSAMDLFPVISKLCYRVCHRFRLTKRDDYFCVDFESSSIFGGCWGSIENKLEPKTEPPSGNLACPNLRNDPYIFKHKSGQK